MNDVVVDYMDYINRAKELGHTAIFSTEHGNSGNIYELYGLCQENGLKCIHGYESYFVFNRHEKTKRNWHICIISLNRNGMRENNYVNSIANIDGFYKQPRIDMELLLQLPPDDVIVTTACVNNCLLFPDEKFDSVKDFLLPLKEYFGEHFFMEIQSHDDDNQIKLNKKLKNLSEKYDIPLIHGCDSHYIFPHQAKERMEYLRGKKFNYDLEDNFILDYPDEKTIHERYKKQGVFSKEEIQQALNNTLVFEKAEDLGFTKDIKMPTIYKKLSLDERLDLLKSHINAKWKEYVKNKNIPEEQKQAMRDGIRKEMEVIQKTNDEIHISDYFLLNEEIIKKGIERGGTITRTGRGSAPSYFINTLLGFSTIDRFSAPIQLFPSRFISTARLLETRSLPDIDFNVAEDTPFIEASKEVLGEEHCYRMIAYGTQKESAAFKNLCRAKGIDFDDANKISKNLELYKDDPKWQTLIEESKKYVGVIDSVSPSPCSFLLLSDDIRKEIGLIRVNGELCANMDKFVADDWKFLKNDILNVTVWKLIADTFKSINKPIPPYEELIPMCDDKVWNLFSKGITATINQCSTPNSKHIVQTYKPKSLAELALYVAMIRPSAASLLQGFIKRKPYTTNIKEIDELLESSYHYMAYQESIMAVLNFLGIKEDETYSIIKKISKKKFKDGELEELKDKLKKGFEIKCPTSNEKQFHDIWQVIEDASAYGFNSSHALCTATDALYGMYLKANYPLEYFTVCLNEYSDDIDMTSNLIGELKNFGIQLRLPKFRYSKGEYIYDKEKNVIHKGINSVKNIGEKDAELLYEIKDEKFDDFFDLLKKTRELGISKTKIDTLIKINFFDEFGGSKKLLDFYELFQEFHGKSQFKKDKIPNWINIEWLKGNSKETEKMFREINMDYLLKEYFKKMENEELPLDKQAELTINLTGSLMVNTKTDKPLYYVQSLNKKFTPLATLYSMQTGEVVSAKIQKRKYEIRPFKEKDFLYISGFEEKFKWYKTETGFVQSDTEKELHVSSYTIKSKRVG